MKHSLIALMLFASANILHASKKKKQPQSRFIKELYAFVNAQCKKEGKKIQFIKANDLRAEKFVINNKPHFLARLYEGKKLYRCSLNEDLSTITDESSPDIILNNNDDGYLSSYVTSTNPTGNIQTSILLTPLKIKEPDPTPLYETDSWISSDNLDDEESLETLIRTSGVPQASMGFYYDPNPPRFQI